jgi:anaerobic selenocysteine-containing dehydrogenase
MVNIYQEKTWDTKSAMTGAHLYGYARYLPGPFDVTGKMLDDQANGFDLRLITHREIMQTKSRTSSNYWLLALLPENAVIMNTADADSRGLKDGDQVRIVSPTNPTGEWDLMNGNRVSMIGKIKTTQGIRPGVISFALGFGHWAYGGVDVSINGQSIPGDVRRIRGFHANAAMRVDPYLGNTTLVDPVGGSAVFYDTLVRIEKV